MLIYFLLARVKQPLERSFLFRLDCRQTLADQRKRPGSPTTGEKNTDRDNPPFSIGTADHTAGTSLIEKIRKTV